MDYKSIAEGTYCEKIPCRVEEVDRAQIKDVLAQGTEGVGVERIPRVVHADAFSLTKQGFHIETDLVPEKDKAYVLRPIHAEKGVLATLVLKYQYFTHSELLKRAGIKDAEFQSGYNRVGHIIHLNLNEETLKHKEIISKILIDKIQDCKTVIRKQSNINKVFRNIDIEHLQGSKNYRTVQKENGLRFCIDYDKVYWNSKLQVERKILVKKISSGETLCDLFCGVGPFSILALSRGATVYANDLNPASIKNFKESVVLNRKALGVVSPSKVWNDEIEDRVFLYNMDAEAFLHQATRDYNQDKEDVTLFSHYILNLPELTLQYLNPFAELEKRAAPGTSYVHAYFFVKSGESPVEKVETAMGRPITCTHRMVRKVSPSKEMWVVSFLLAPSSSIPIS